MVKETEEEGEEEEEGLEYATDTPSGGSYTTPPSTGGWSSPSLAPNRSPTPGGSDPENNAVLHTKELEAHIEAFLEEAEEDMEMNNLPLLENTSLLLVPLYKEPHCSQDWNPPELVNGSEPVTEMNDPQCLAELCRNLLKEYWSRTQDPPPLLSPPPPSPQPSLPPLQACSVEPATTDDLGNNKPTSPRQ